MNSLLACQKTLRMTPSQIAFAFDGTQTSIFRRAADLSFDSVRVVDDQYLATLRNVLALDTGLAARLIRDATVDHLVAQCESLLSSVQSPTLADRERIVALMTLRGIVPTELGNQWNKLERVFSIQSLRNGTLPKLTVKIAMRPGESCHFHDECVFEWQSNRGQQGTMSGDLFVTNQRLIVATCESSGTFEIKLSSVVDFDIDEHRLTIRCTAAKGTGRYLVRDCEVLEATMAGVLRNDHPQAARSRVIPSFVKQQVWARDDGKCVLCGAFEEIHFDHELPFSKGGSNTVENIRLLCAHCNLAKSDRIE